MVTSVSGDSRAHPSIHARTGGRLVLGGDGNCRHDAEQRSARYQMADAVLFIGSVEHHRVPKILSIADVAVPLLQISFQAKVDLPSNSTSTW